MPDTFIKHSGSMQQLLSSQKPGIASTKQNTIVMVWEERRDTSVREPCLTSAAMMGKRTGPTGTSSCAGTAGKASATCIAPEVSAPCRSCTLTASKGLYSLDGSDSLDNPYRQQRHKREEGTCNAALT